MYTLKDFYPLKFYFFPKLYKLLKIETMNDLVAFKNNLCFFINCLSPECTHNSNYKYLLNHL